MKKSILFSVLVLVCSAAVCKTIDVYYTGMTLLQMCEPDYSDNMITTSSKAVCKGYLTGITDFHAGGTNANVLHKLWCLDKGVSSTQLRLIVVKYLKARPEELHFEGSSLVTGAFAQAFPCE